jgi:adenosine deaminase
MEELLARMPKAELHVHIEGALEPDLLFAMARRNGVDIGYGSAAELAKAYDFKDLTSFLEVYIAGTRVLAKRGDFQEMADAYLARAAADNVRHAEIFFDTQTHVGYGTDPKDVILGLSSSCESVGSRHAGMSSGLILCFLRHMSEESAFESLEGAMPYLDKIAGVGLASAEMGNPPEKFKRVFAKAKKLGLRLVAHAGEEGPASYIRSALDDLGVERVDHGVRVFEDPALVARLASERIALTVCPLSNVRLKVFNDMRGHTLGRMMEAGLACTVNSDDPSYFGGGVNANFLAVHAGQGLSPAQAYALARNSFEASFIESSRKAALVSELDECFERLGHAPRAAGAKLGR